MPQLPSGQHIAFDVMPLHDMLETWHLDESRQTLAGLSVKEDLLPFTRILEMVPANQDDAPMAMLNGSETPPEKMTPPGYRQAPERLPRWLGRVVFGRQGRVP